MLLLHIHPRLFSVFDHNLKTNQIQEICLLVIHKTCYHPYLDNHSHWLMELFQPLSRHVYKYLNIMLHLIVYLLVPPIVLSIECY